MGLFIYFLAEGKRGGKFDGNLRLDRMPGIHRCQFCGEEGSAAALAPLFDSREISVVFRVVASLREIPFRKGYTASV